MPSAFVCGGEGRRQAILGQAAPQQLNGIDFLEVGSDQLTLRIRFLFGLPGTASPVPPAAPPLQSSNVMIEGGRRVGGLSAQVAGVSGATLTVKVGLPGGQSYPDFSTYTFRLVRADGQPGPPDGFDPQLSEVRFSFKVDCPSDFDCLQDDACPLPALAEPVIDYQAKDYASFRRLMLDRISALMPDWKETNAADQMVALVELAAYVGDRLSYFQDAVATEAYLGTARRRSSVRRHARLLDYFMHDGCNARAYVCFEVSAASVALPARTRLLSRGPQEEPVVDPTPVRFQALLDEQRPVLFETMQAATLRSAHNQISLYPWDEAACCLPAGAIAATLLDNPPLSLTAGDLLAFLEIAGPTSGKPADADRSHRHVVRLTEVRQTSDPLHATAVLEVGWADEDALPFPLCVSDAAGGEVAIATGNVVLADHGLTVQEALAPVPDAGRYRPRLSLGPLTYRAGFKPSGPAAEALATSPRRALPDIRLSDGQSSWQPELDLLGSAPFRRDFVVEMETGGEATLRFGDGVHGLAPEPRLALSAGYRIGNGVAGNVGAGVIGRVAWAGGGISRVYNPLPATGGTEPEALELVRQVAPQAFKTQERAVTEDDYATVAAGAGGIQRAEARLRWTGSWYTARVTVDRKGGRSVDPSFHRQVADYLDRYRMAGVDVDVAQPVEVPLEIDLDVCVDPGHFRGQVEKALADRLSARDLGGGRLGFFHPDNLTFGQAVYLSQIYEAALDVPGVQSVVATIFQRWAGRPNQELQKQVLVPNEMEIVRCDSDPDFPENGGVRLNMLGGL